MKDSNLMTTLDITVPLSSTRAGYDPERQAARYAMNSDLIKNRYHYEKIIGKRKGDGALKLKELKPEHKQYVSCYLNGMKGVEIAEHFNVAAITVYRVLADPLAAKILGEFDTAFKNEFRALFPLVAEAIREGLESGGITTRLKAVDRWTKVSKFIDGDVEEGEGLRTEAIFAARLKFVDTIKKITEGATLAEAEIITVVSEHND